MDYSIQSLMLASLNMNGSAILTGNQTASNPKGWLGFKTIDGSVVLGGVTGSNISGINYLVGKTIPHPTTFYGQITNIAVASGSSGIQLIN